MDTDAKNVDQALADLKSDELDLEKIIKYYNNPATSDGSPRQLVVYRSGVPVTLPYVVQQVIPSMVSPDSCHYDMEAQQWALGCSIVQFVFRHIDARFPFVRNFCLKHRRSWGPAQLTGLEYNMGAIVCHMAKNFQTQVTRRPEHEAMLYPSPRFDGMPTEQEKIRLDEKAKAAAYFAELLGCKPKTALTLGTAAATAATTVVTPEAAIEEIWQSIEKIEQTLAPAV